ncbi:tRNA-uridine aminocarboxypropyltransferase [Catenovulum adriaticum]|uniref:tRNA-uridine aminocarboxypropyltransferase n=1 Tax=Catenovulum adriaticum TaxID=2984846 RepID=A0ABY7ARZ6_9ALTE|nr:DTW domain-containing protein [Catenovulum sp. TS8]WAJ72299.1 DTW domain-containing protein [Catenovulum sp. TS8]
MHNSYSFSQLRTKRLARATRPFLARGISVARCQSCHLAQFACICSWKRKLNIQMDLVLLMHTDEILKPTNTGKLISDILPNNCFAFEWSRTEPEKALLALLQDPNRFVVILYPTQATRTAYQSPVKAAGNKKLTLIVIDGTWRQSKKIFNLSPWLQPYPTLDLSLNQQASYELRKAPHAHQLSTAEATAQALKQCQQQNASELLHHYFNVFNLHYSAARIGQTPAPSISHQALEQYP